MPFLSPLSEGTVPGIPYPLNPACPVDGGQPVHPLCANAACSVRHVLSHRSLVSSSVYHTPCTLHPAPHALTGHVVSRCC